MVSFIIFLKIIYIKCVYLGVFLLKYDMIKVRIETLKTLVLVVQSDFFCYFSKNYIPCNRNFIYRLL